MIGVLGFLPKEKMRISSVQNVCEQFAESFSIRSYKVDFHAHEGGAIGVCSHRGDTGHSIAVSYDNKIAVAFVGEILNLEDITRSNNLKAPADEAHLILQLYQKDLLPAISNANGLFCACVYDSNRKLQKLITDRYASFPIHYHIGNKRTTFATSIYAMLSDPSIPHRPCEVGISQLFTLQRTLGPYTNISGIKPVPSASIATITKKGISFEKYWHLKWVNQCHSDMEVADRLVSALRRAVVRQCETPNGSAGLLLSGGIDSRLILGSAVQGTLSSWTVASYEDNPELAIAQSVARCCNSDFNPIINVPEQIFEWEKTATIENNGLYPASPQYSSFVQIASSACGSLLCGHGLDYTLRGYYLPSKFLNMFGSSTRLPALRKIKRPIDGSTVLYNLRQGPPRSTLNRVIRHDKANHWWEGLESCFNEVLAPWTASDDPVNAWDAFLVNQVSQHYAFTGMMSVRAVANLRMPAFDNEVFGVYLSMSPRQRVSGAAVYFALEKISRELSVIPNANTGFRAGIGPWKEIFALLGRASLRRMRLLEKVQVPTVKHSAGSWQNLANLFRYDERYRKKLLEIRDRLDGLSFGLLDQDQLAICIDNHMSGEELHTKLIRQLLTHYNWVTAYNISD